jgi:hypothetical protein
LAWFRAFSEPASIGRLAARSLNVPAIQLSVFHEFPALHWSRVASWHPRGTFYIHCARARKSRERLSTHRDSRIGNKGTRRRRSICHVNKRYALIYVHQIYVHKIYVHKRPYSCGKAYVPASLDASKLDFSGARQWAMGLTSGDTTPRTMPAAKRQVDFCTEVS